MTERNYGGTSRGPEGSHHHDYDVVRPTETSTEPVTEEARRQAEETAAQARQAAKDTAEQAKQAAQQVAEKAKEPIDEARQKAEDVLETAKERASSTVNDRKGRAASSLDHVAQALRETGEELRGDNEAMMATYAEKAADRLDEWSTSLREKDLDDMVRDAEYFARRQPEVFLLGAFALGLMAARFLKSSGEYVR